MKNGNGDGTMLSRYAGKNVLAVGGHPDDLELGVGGTLAKLARAGSKVTMIIVTVPNNLDFRVKEAKKAAEILGCELKVLYGDKAQRVENVKTYELVAHLDKLVREHDPAVVISHSERNFHKDHILTHHACQAAQRLHFFDFLCYYPTSCHPVSVPFHPQAYVDITDTIEDKMKAIDQHTTQFTCKGLTTNHYRDVARDYGRVAGTEYAEGLEVVRLRLG